MSEPEKRILENYQAVVQRATNAAVSAGRAADEVTIVGVTKYVDAETANQLFAAGCQNLGESRPQVLEEKATALTDQGITWHMIGHLQRNKVARTLQYSQLIHSVDSLKLAGAINRIAGESPDRITPVEILLEVNVSGEEAKHGFHPDEMPQAVEDLVKLESVSLRGLMCMAGLASSDVETREQFARLRNLRDDFAKPQLPDGHHFDQLSMGMSGDFEMAIAEGATLVRVGSVLFEGAR